MTVLLVWKETHPFSLHSSGHFQRKTTSRMQIASNSHVFLWGTGGLSLLHGLVGSHPQLALLPLPPLPGPALQTASTSTCYPQKLWLPSFDWDPCGEGRKPPSDEVSSGWAHCAAVQRMSMSRSHQEQNSGWLRTLHFMHSIPSPLSLNGLVIFLLLIWWVTGCTTRRNEMSKYRM